MEVCEPELRGEASAVPGFESGDWLDPAVVYCECPGRHLMSWSAARARRAGTASTFPLSPDEDG